MTPPSDASLNRLDGGNKTLLTVDFSPARHSAPMYAYLILGAGKQGVAAAYDLIKFGHASRLTVADGSSEAVHSAVRKLRKLLGSKLRQQKIRLVGKTVNATSRKALARLMPGHDAV